MSEYTRLIAERNQLDLLIRQAHSTERRQVLKDIQTKIITYRISLADLAAPPAQKRAERSPLRCYCWLCRAPIKEEAG
ncbi:hypothetical protein [Paraburkholderia sediminicola]|uniref:hypothetical protein n=1 Tax=Paraburkholderia sediminicola TaxID=458836 RepID=UPI0038BB4DA7